MQAILIMAHRDMEQIIELTGILRKKFEVYIHFDTKMNVSSEEKANLQQMGAHVYQVVNVRSPAAATARKSASRAAAPTLSFS